MRLDLRLTTHALDAQNKRGGRVKLLSLTTPETEYNHLEKGDALYAMELTLSLEVRRDVRDTWRMCVLRCPACWAGSRSTVHVIKVRSKHMGVGYASLL